MAAVSATVPTLLRSGDWVVSVPNSYSGAIRRDEVLLQQFGVSVTYVNCTDLDATACSLPGA
ncbi:hypothetical protein [Leisingera sp. JC11]|uniref:hypothetical protein n=1 Tax=Leisingera sp. JC11 TaxID=3042469 RepID=UPI0034543BF5